MSQARRGGNERAGFELGVHLGSRILRIRAWGLWDALIADGYRTAMLKSFDAFVGNPWAALIDLRRFPPQRPEVLNVRRELLVAAVAKHLERIAAVVDSSLPAMQLKRIAEASGMYDVSFFEQERDALIWLAHPSPVSMGDAARTTEPTEPHRLAALRVPESSKPPAKLTMPRG